MCLSRDQGQALGAGASVPGLGKDAYLGEGTEHDVGFLKLFLAVGRRDRDHLHAGGFGRLNTGRRVFDDDARLQARAEDIGPLQVGLRMGLAVLDVVRRHEALRQRQPDVPHAA